MPNRNPHEFLGLGTFIWFYGVVEDRADPLRLGRVRVRCFGWHTEDKVKVPTESLPWAQVVMPVTTPDPGAVSMPEGTWVMGFFADGTAGQFPFILGTVPGIATEEVDSSKGFNDPYGVYPKDVGEPGTSRLGRDWYEAERHLSLIQKRKTRVTDVPTARIVKLSSTAHDLADSKYESVTWDEPHPRAAAKGEPSSLYPYNAVEETESGHIVEFDDTPEFRRIHEMHASGTFREIQNDGKRVTKIVGDDYEIVIGGKNVLVKGNCNVTIGGDARLMVYGDLVTEVNGNYHLNVHGDMLTKINGNESKEINGGSSTQINQDRSTRVTGSSFETIGVNMTEMISKNKTSMVAINSSALVGSNTIISTTNKYTTTAGGTLDILSVGAMGIAAATNVTVKSSGTMLLETSDLNLGAMGGLGVSRIGDKDLLLVPMVEGSFTVKAA